MGESDRWKTKKRGALKMKDRAKQKMTRFNSSEEFDVVGGGGCQLQTWHSMLVTGAAEETERELSANLK